MKPSKMIFWLNSPATWKACEKHKAIMTQEHTRPAPTMSVGSLAYSEGLDYPREFAGQDFQLEIIFWISSSLLRLRNVGTKEHKR